MLEVTYKLDVEPECEDPEGFFASGNDEHDAEMCREIRRRDAQGDVWGWCCVLLTAKVEVDGQVFTGTASLGACSYKDEADFTQPGGYYDDMKHEALERLMHNLQADVKRGKVATSVLEGMDKQGYDTAIEEG